MGITENNDPETIEETDEKVTVNDAETAPEETKKDGKPEKKHMNQVLSWVLVIAAAVAVAVLLDSFVVINSAVPSGSMETTIMTGDRMFGFRLAYVASDPQRGDIIIFKFPDDNSQIFVKRIIGMPGDTIEIKKGVTYINGEAYDEPYLKETPNELDFPAVTVPEGSYFVMGDNRNNSRDSRYWNDQFVERDEILGKAFFRYWPLSSIGTIS